MFACMVQKITPAKADEALAGADSGWRFPTPEAKGLSRQDS